MTNERIVMDDQENPMVNGIPEGIARMEALDSSIALLCPEDTYETVMIRAWGFYHFLTSGRTLQPQEPINRAMVN